MATPRKAYRGSSRRRKPGGRRIVVTKCNKTNTGNDGSRSKAGSAVRTDKDTGLVDAGGNEEIASKANLTVKTATSAQTAGASKGQCSNDDAISSSKRPKTYRGERVGHLQDISVCAQNIACDTKAAAKDDSANLQYYSQSAMTLGQHRNICQEQALSLHNTTQRDAASQNREGHQGGMAPHPVYPLVGLGANYNVIPIYAPHIHTTDRFSACIPCRKRKIRCIPSGNSHAYDVNGKIVGICATCQRRGKECEWPEVNASSTQAQGGTSRGRSTARIAIEADSDAGKQILAATKADFLPRRSTKRGKQALIQQLGSTNNEKERIKAIKAEQQLGAEPTHLNFAMWPPHAVPVQDDVALREHYLSITEANAEDSILSPGKTPCIPTLHFLPSQEPPSQVKSWHLNKGHPSPALTQSPSSSGSIASPLNTPLDARFSESVSGPYNVDYGSWLLQYSPQASQQEVEESPGSAMVGGMVELTSQIDTWQQQQQKELEARVAAAEAFDMPVLGEEIAKVSSTSSEHFPISPQSFTCTVSQNIEGMQYGMMSSSNMTSLHLQNANCQETDWEQEVSASDHSTAQTPSPPAPAFYGGKQDLSLANFSHNIYSDFISPSE